MLLVIASVACLLLITWFDVRYRTIPVVLLLIEIVLSLVIMVRASIPGYFPMLLLTIVFALIYLSILWGWFALVRKKSSFFDHLLGWGDVVMVGLVAIHFSPMPFMVFLMVASCLGLVWHGVQQAMATVTHTTIPLGAVMALLLVPVQILLHLGHHFFYLIF